MRRTSCSACGHTDLEPFLDLGMSPIADAYTDLPDGDSPVFPLEVAVCGKCRLAQLLEVVDGEVLFGSGYSFYTSASPPLSAYHAAYAAAARARWGQLAEKGVVEVGCNDGDLLRHFADFPALGVDPAAGPARAATARGLEVQVRPFGLAAALDIRDERGPQGLIFANHVLAHVADVADMLAGIAVLLAYGGIAMIEVQYLPDLLVNNAFDLVYHEHRNFFSLSSLEQALLRHGLHIVEAALTDRQGGSLRVTVSQHRYRHVSECVNRLRASETWLQQWGAYAGMQGRAERIRARLLDLLTSSGQIAGYGAPAKATTLLNFCGLTANRVEWVVDTTVAKQGRHIPGTRIPIVAPGMAPRPDAYVLLAHNYARQIMAANPGERWILPIPSPVIL